MYWRRLRASLSTYRRYFKYIAVHKWYVFIECLKIGCIWHGITHDLSKFLPSEFFPYAAKFYSGDYAYKYFEVENAFDIAFCLHQHRNKHHWDYWVPSDGKPVPMPFKYVSQMVIDWTAMGRVFNDTAADYYKEHKAQMKLHTETIERIEEILSYR